MVTKIYHYDCSSFKLLDVDIIECETKEECELSSTTSDYYILHLKILNIFYILVIFYNLIILNKDIS